MGKKSGLAAAISNFVGSKEYKDTKKKIISWEKRLEKADEKEVMQIRTETCEFFKKMRNEQPRFYSAFELKDKQISEAISGKLSGTETIIE